VFRGPIGGSGGVSIAGGIGRALWYGDIALNKIVKMTTKGVSKGYSIPTPGAGPEGIAKGRNKQMWFTEWNQAKIGSITRKGHVREFAISGGASGSTSMTAGPDGRIWFTTSSMGIGAHTIGGSTTFYSTGIDSEDPTGIAVGPDGNLWYTTFHGPHIGMMTTSGAATSFNVGAFGGFGLTAGPDHRVWFADPGNYRIVAISTNGISMSFYSTGTVQPFNIVTAPDRYMYFTTGPGAKIGRISVHGKIAECPIRAPQSFVALGITVGPDGNVWILDNQHSQVARLRI
jgi:virginiamycin B lyase